MKNNGFTIVELVLIVAIISTLLGIAMFSFNYWSRKIKVKDFVFELASEINYARDLARREGKRVILVILKPGSNNQDWTGNNNIDPICYFIFEDDNKNGVYDSGEKIITYNKCKGVEITTNQLMRDYGTDGKSLVFFPVGLPLVGDSDKTITFCSKSNNHISYSIKIHSITGIGEIVQ